MYEAKYILALFLIFAFFASGLDRDIFSYERLEMKKGASVYTFSYKPPSGIFKIVKEIPIGRGALYTVIPERDSNTEELVKNIGTIANISPVSIPWQTCFPVGVRDHFSFSIHTKNSLPESLFKNTSSPISFAVKETKMSKGWYDTLVNAEIEPCTPRILNVLDETIKKSLGDTPYFLSNLNTQ